MNNDPLSLLVFVKYPRPGRVKTRLGMKIGMRAAARLYQEFTAITLGRFRHWKRTKFTIYFDPPEEENAVRAWLGAEYDYWPQPPGDLGVKLRFGLERMLEQSGPAIAVGTDSPDLPLPYVEKAAAALQTKDLVVGPARDGGYYLIGLSRLAPELFDGVPWSTPGVLEASWAKAAEKKLTMEILPTWYDVDTIEDLRCLWRSPEPEIQALVRRFPIPWNDL